LTIKFAESKRTVILEEQAKILRGDSLISGPIIEYFIDEKRVQAGQDSVLAPERVEVIIPAKTQEP
jgi:lipopolysaccharide export system protein LptA